MKLIAVGDPHIEATRAGDDANVSASRLIRLVEHVNSRHDDAEYCLFLGDLTHEGDVAAYERFRELIAPLKMPAALMIGNHDHRGNFQAVFPEAHQDAHGFVQFAVDLGDSHRLIGLDSLNAPPYDPLRRHVGLLCPNRTAFLERALTEAGNRETLVAIHHQPFPIGLPGMDVIRLLNGDEFLSLIRQYDNVKLLLMGHNHRTISGVTAGLPFACFKSLSRQNPLDFETLDPNAGIAEPPDYGVLLLNEESILVHHEEFTVDAQPVSDWAEQIAENPQMGEGYNRLASVMLPNWQKGKNR